MLKIRYPLDGTKLCHLEDIFSIKHNTRRSTMKAIKIGTKVEIYNDTVMTYNELPAREIGRAHV